MGLTSLTVFLVADDEYGAQLRETFVRWSREHLVGLSAWVTPASAQVFDFGPPMAQARIVEDGTAHAEDLFRFIGKYRLNVVRVVLGQLAVGDDAPIDAVLQETAGSIVDAIDRALPKSPREDGHSTQLWRINVVAPVSGVGSVHPRTLMQGWNVNAIVSAEDRPDADHANVFVRDPGNAVEHAAAALAAAGGVFSGVEPGMFEALAESQSTSNGREILVARVAARAVVGDDAETRLAVQTLEEVKTEPKGAAAFVEWGRPAVNPDRVVTDLHSYLVGSDPWRSVEPMRGPRLAQEPKGFKVALRDAFRFDVKMLAVVPGWVARRGKAKLEDMATDAIVGQGADTLVRFNPTTPEGMRNSAAAILRQVDDMAQREEVERAAESVATPDTSAWAHLRSVAFAAVDGGELPAEVEVPRYAGVREVLPVERVVPDPLDSYTGRGRTVKPSDAAGIRLLSTEIHEDLQRRSADLSRFQRALNEAETAIVDADEALGAATGDLEVAEAADEDLAEAKAAKSRAKRALHKAELARDGARSSTERAQAAFDAVSAEYDAFLVWVERIQGSVVFRLIDDVAKRSDGFRERHEILRAALKVMTPESDDLVRAQRTLWRWWGVTVGLWLVLLLGVGVTYLFVDRQGVDPRSLETVPEAMVWVYENWYRMLLGITVLTFAVLLWANHLYYRANRRYLWAVQSAAEGRLRASEDLVFTGREAARLRHLNPALADWASIIGWVIHHPYSAVEDLTHDIDASVVETLPAAFAIARVSHEDEIPTQTIVQAVRLLHPNGWAASAFDHAYAVHQVHTVSEDPAGLIAADLDEGDSAYGPRHALLQFWEGGSASKVLTAEAVDALRQAVLDRRIVLATRRVARLGEYSTGAVVSEPDFFRGVATADTAFVGDMFTESARVEGKQNVHRSAVWLPPIANGNGVDDCVRLHVGRESVAMRADITRLLTTEDLAMFRADRPADAKAIAAEGDAGEWA